MLDLDELYTPSALKSSIFYIFGFFALIYSFDYIQIISREYLKIPSLIDLAGTLIIISSILIFVLLLYLFLGLILYSLAYFNYYGTKRLRPPKGERGID